MKKILQVKKDILLSHLEMIVVPVNGIKMKRVIKGKYIHLQVENTVQIYPRIMEAVVDLEVTGLVDEVATGQEGVVLGGKVFTKYQIVWKKETFKTV